MAVQSTHYPVLLLPLRLEVRFVRNESKGYLQLWLRILPDVIFLNSLRRELSSEEWEDRALFLAADETDREAREAAWAVLVDKYGAYRAKWIIHSGADKPDDDAEDRFLFDWLPNYFKVYLYLTNGELIEENTSIVPRPLVALGEVAGLGDDGWQVHFRDSANGRGAIGSGMGLIINLARLNNAEELGKYKLIERIVVVGLNDEGDDDSTLSFASLLHQHEHTDGVAVLDYGAATNNEANRLSAYSGDEEFRAAESFHYAVEGLALSGISPFPATLMPPNDHFADQDAQDRFEAAFQALRTVANENEIRSHADRLSGGLGLDKSHFKHIRNANGRGNRLNDLIKRASWFALGGQGLNLLLGPQWTSADQQWLWEHVCHYVAPEGILPAIRIDDEPYGILPVTRLARNDATSREIPEARREQILRGVLENLRDAYSKMLDEHDHIAPGETNYLIPRKEKDVLSDTDLTRMLTQQPATARFQIGVYGAPRVQGEISPFYTQELDLPFAPDSLPAEQLHELLRDQKRFQSAADRSDRLSNVFASLLQNPDLPLDDQSIDKDILTQLKLNPLAGFTPLTAYRLSETPDENDPVRVDMLPRNDNWYLGDFFDLACQLNAIEPPVPNEAPLRFYKDHPSVLTDWLYRSYRNAARLYHRRITFAPSLEEIEALRASKNLRVDKYAIADGTSVAAGATVVTLIADGPDETTVRIPIRARFGGVVQHSAAAGDRINRAGQALFLLKNEEKDAEIRRSMGRLFAGIIMACHEYEDAKKRREALHQALCFSYDISSHRLDAWISSLANQQLARLRSNRPEGLYYGAYGYLENLRMDRLERLASTATMTDPYTVPGGIIHAPSTAQAVTGALLRNAYLTELTETDDRNPYTLNLTSERLQEAQYLLGGLREDQEIEALLGFRLERWLHEHEEPDLHGTIYALRRTFPLKVNASEFGGEGKNKTELAVVDGLSFLRFYETTLGPNDLPDENLFATTIRQKVNATNERGGPGISPKEARALFHYARQLSHSLDGSLDALLFEASHQLVGGNLARASAAMEAYQGLSNPPELEAVRTPLSGNTITHRFALLFPITTVTVPALHPRAFLNPHLETWLRGWIGPLDRIECTVEVSFSSEEQAFETVRLSETDLDHTELFYLCQDTVEAGNAPLETRLWQATTNRLATGGPEPTGFRVIPNATPEAGNQPLAHVLESCRRAYQLLTSCEPLTSTDLQPEADAVSHPWEDLVVLWRERLAPLIGRMIGPKDRQNWPEDWPGLPAGWQADDNGQELSRTLRQFVGDLPKKLWQTPLDAADSAIYDYIHELGSKALLGLSNWVSALPTYREQNDFDNAFEELRAIAHGLFGKDYVLFSPALPGPAQASWFSEDAQMQLVGDDAHVGGEERLWDWLHELAPVRERALSFEDWNLLNAATRTNGKIPETKLYVAQDPMDRPWVGLSKAEMKTVKNAFSRGAESSGTAEDAYPAAADSWVVAATPNTIPEPEQPVYGILIDAFEEKIPDEKQTTGVSFHYDAPNAEPPQNLLLATPWPGIRPTSADHPGTPWDEEHLRDVVVETMDLAKARLIDQETMDEFGFALPLHQFPSLTGKSLA